MNRRLSALLAALLLAPAGLGAQSRPVAARPSVFASEPTSWHTVRPGETLRGITARFLGSSELWQEIHRLNPGIADPDRIAPGQRIRVPAEKSSIPAARLERLSRQVEEQPSPIPWQSAQVGDMLVERDAVRTRQKSSAEMQFLDGARLTVTEDSLVFLQRSGVTLAGSPKKSIEIVQGQAELNAQVLSASAPPPEVEIVLGNTRATSRPDAKGPARTRARRAEEGGAKLMAYGGESEVEAGGAKVRVQRGMGTSVATQGPPSPPEPLLPAPVLAGPEPDAERACADPAPRLAGRAAGRLLHRRGLPRPRLRRPGRPPGRRDGNRMAPRRAAGRRSLLAGDRPQPLGARRLPERGDPSRHHLGKGRPAGGPAAEGSLQVGGPQLRVGDRLYVSPAATVTIASDKPARWLPVIGGKQESAWPATWSPGEHTAGAVAEDGCGGHGHDRAGLLHRRRRAAGHPLGGGGPLLALRPPGARQRAGPPAPGRPAERRPRRRATPGSRGTASGSSPSPGSPARRRSRRPGSR